MRLRLLSSLLLVLALSSFAHADAIFVTDGYNLWNIDRTDGTLSNEIALQVAQNSNGVSSMAFSSDGTLFALADDILYTIDPTTGALTAISGADTGAGFYYGNDMRFDSNGNLYGISGSTYWQLDTTTGLASNQSYLTYSGGSSSSPLSPGTADALAPSALNSGQFTTVLDAQGGQGNYLGSIDPGSGEFNFEAQIVDPTSLVESMDLSLSDGNDYGLVACAASNSSASRASQSAPYYTAPSGLPTIDLTADDCTRGSVSFFSINETTLTGMGIAAETEGLTAIAIQPDSAPGFVPEPASLALFSLGAGALTYVRRRRRRSA